MYERDMPVIVLMLAAMSGVTVSADQDVLVSDWDNDRIVRYDANTGAFIEEFVETGSGGLNAPQGLALGPDGNFYVASSRSDQVLRYDGNTGDFIDSFTDPADDGNLDTPHGMVFGPDGDLFVSAGLNHAVFRFDGRTGEFIGAFVAPGSGGLNRPTALVFGPDENLYVSSSDSVLRFDGGTGEFIDVFVSASAGDLDTPQGLLFTAPDNNLLVADWAHHGGTRVLLYDGKTGSHLRPFADEQLTGPHGLARGPNGNLWVIAQQPGRVVRFDGTTGVFIDVALPDIGGDPTYLIFHDLPAPCPADLNGDGVVDAVDVAVLLGVWGGSGPADLTDDGVVDSFDLAIVLGAWGPCGTTIQQPRGRR